MQNYTRRQLAEIIRSNRRISVCGAGYRFFMRYTTVRAAWLVCTHPGWMNVLLKFVLWDHMTAEEQASVDSALASTGITERSNYVDELKAAQLRNALPDFFGTE